MSVEAAWQAVQRSSPASSAPASTPWTPWARAPSADSVPGRGLREHRAGQRHGQEQTGGGPSQRLERAETSEGSGVMNMIVTMVAVSPIRVDRR